MKNVVPNLEYKNLKRFLFFKHLCKNDNVIGGWLMVDTPLHIYYKNMPLFFRLKSQYYSLKSDKNLNLSGVIHNGWLTQRFNYVIN